jgi:hypothetical protein
LRIIAKWHHTVAAAAAASCRPLNCEWDLTSASGNAFQLSIPVNFDASDDFCPALLIFNPAYTIPGDCEEQGFPDPALVTAPPFGVTLAARYSCNVNGAASRWTLTLSDALPAFTSVALQLLAVGLTGTNIDTSLPISYVFTNPGTLDVLPTPNSTIRAGTITSSQQAVEVELAPGVALVKDLSVSVELLATPLLDNQDTGTFQVISTLRSYISLTTRSPRCSWDLSAATGDTVSLFAAPSAGSDFNCPSLELTAPAFTEDSNCFGDPTLNQDAGGVALVSSRTCRSSDDKWANTWGVRVAFGTPVNVRPRLASFVVGASGAAVDPSGTVAYSLFGDAGTSDLSVSGIAPPIQVFMGNPLTLSRSLLTFQMMASQLEGSDPNQLFQRVLELRSAP